MSEVPPEKLGEKTRSIIDCHHCRKQFVAIFDSSINGNHVVYCAHCGHEHCRVITDGKITGDRWDSRYGGDKEKDGIKARRVWKVNGQQMEASSASFFIRERWLNKQYS